MASTWAAGPVRRIGILTGGGDAPGLNAVIRAVVKRAVGQLHWQVVGIEDSFNGLMEHPPRIRELDPRTCQGLLARGGTILGTTNRGDPFAWGAEREDRSADLVRSAAEEGLEGLIVVGGDGTQRIAWRLMQEHGLPVIGVPKTIDNDLAATDLTFGFMSAVDVATEALDRLHTTAEAHDRVMLLEVMGRDAGHIALWAGLAGGADVIVLPETGCDIQAIEAKILKRRELNRPFTLIVVAEGAQVPDGDDAAPPDAHGSVRAGGPAVRLARRLSRDLGVETRVTVLGHLQRGGSPVPFDRVLATRFGIKAVELVQQDRWGEMVCLRCNDVVSVPLAEATAHQHFVDPQGELVRTARAVGIVV